MIDDDDLILYFMILILVEDHFPKQGICWDYSSVICSEVPLDLMLDYVKHIFESKNVYKEIMLCLE